MAIEDKLHRQIERNYELLDAQPEPLPDAEDMPIHTWLIVSVVVGGLIWIGLAATFGPPIMAWLQF